MDLPRIRFKLGRLVITPAALVSVTKGGQHPWEFVVRHLPGDWGDLNTEDKRLNDEAVEGGDRILSAYHTAKGVKLYLITEADRSATTVLLPDEY